jgi:hypothetical protein
LILAAGKVTPAFALVLDFFFFKLGRAALDVVTCLELVAMGSLFLSFLGMLFLDFFCFHDLN